MSKCNHCDLSSCIENISSYYVPGVLSSDVIEAFWTLLLELSISSLLSKCSVVHFDFNKCTLLFPDFTEGFFFLIVFKCYWKDIWPRFSPVAQQYMFLFVPLVSAQKHSQTFSLFTFARRLKSSLTSCLEIVKKEKKCLQCLKFTKGAAYPQRWSKNGGGEAVKQKGKISWNFHGNLIFTRRFW